MLVSPHQLRTPYLSLRDDNSGVWTYSDGGRRGVATVTIYGKQREGQEAEYQRNPCRRTRGESETLVGFRGEYRKPTIRTLYLDHKPDLRER